MLRNMVPSAARRFGGKSSKSSVKQARGVGQQREHDDEYDDDDDKDDNLSSSRSLDSSGTNTTMASSSLHDLEQWARLLEGSDDGGGGVEVKDRTWRLRTYKRCFVGTEAVNFMVQRGIALSRPHAVQIGQELESRLNLLEHVCRDHDFQDAHLFYRFVPRKQRFVSIDNLAAVLDMQQHSNSKQEDDDDSNDDYSNVSSSSTSTNTSRSIIGGMGMGMVDVEQAFLNCGIVIKDRRFHFTVYPNCFVGSEAVTQLLSTGIVKTRAQAVLVGKRLQEERNLFVHVTGDHGFEDDYFFYKIIPESDRVILRNNIGGGNNAPNNKSRQERSLDEIAQEFYRGVKVKDRTYRLKTYKSAFVGSKAVDWLIRHKVVESRQEAVELGRTLGSDLQVFRHVTEDHPFQDDYLFYHFLPPSKWKSSALLKEEKQQDELQEQLLLEQLAKNVTKSEQHDDNGDDNAATDFRQLQELADMFRRGVKVQNNRHLGKIHRRTFRGSQAVDFMVNSSMAKTRREAVEIGRRLASPPLRLFEHVYGEHDFSDDVLFYRFAGDRASRRGAFMSNISGLSDLSGSFSSSASLSLEKMAELFQKGVVVKDRRYHFRTYKKCFVGSEAVDFLVGSALAGSRMEAVDIGRSLAREFQLFEHVTGDHEFKDEHLFYRMVGLNTSNETLRPYPKLSIENSRLFQMAQLFEAGIEVKENRHRMRVYRNSFVGREAVDFIVKSKMASSRSEAVMIGRAFAKEFNLIEHVTRDHLFSDANVFFRFLSKGQRHSWFKDQSMHSVTLPELVVHSDDLEWAQRVKEFETRILLKWQTAKNGALTPFCQDNMEDMSISARRMRCWASELRRLDPRYQIHNFFSDLAREGGHNIEETEMNATLTRPLLRYFPRSSVFTVWRPTAFEAIRRMMLGEAVGKSLDIKGKSAKRGKLKAFVPFLQISDNKHKRRIRPLPKDGTVRLFFKTDARRARDIVAEKLEEVAEEMMKIVKEARRVLADDRADDRGRKDAMDSMLLDMSSPSISYVDDYAPQCYGLDIPVRLFWEAYYMRQDCTRKSGSEYDMGRPSQPAFQDMNFASLRSKRKEGGPRTVLIQNADPDSPMNPFEVLMAYEEMGQVLPVVSDFDCFLVGSRGIRYSSPLPLCQRNTLQRCVSRIETILDGSTPELRHASWTNRWLDVLKTESASAQNPKTPMYGFGDPKSYSIMKNAVNRLKRVGAVRHGAESFNYEFPQELDDEYLIVYDNLPGGIPWKYVDVQGLQSFLNEKIDDGFTFPLHVKWILCDENWKFLYDRLMRSENKNVADSLNVWFPPESGIREKIDEIHGRHPNGFSGLRFGTSPSLRQSGAMALADLALDETVMSTQPEERMESVDEIEQFA